MKKVLAYLVFGLMGAVLIYSCSKDSPTDPQPTPSPQPEPSIALKLPPKEMRGAWIVTAWSIDWPKSKNQEAQKKEFTNLLDRLKELNFNAVFFQVKGLGDAFYDSPYEPWSAAITGIRGEHPGYDVLQFLIDETHARNLEFHAWMNPYRIATAPPYPELHPNIDPSWVKDYESGGRIYNPALPEVRQRLSDIVKDLISKYDVDGIHFDDYFYPSGGEHNDQAEYTKYGSGYSSIGNFRRSNVDKTIEGVFNTIKENKPQVVFSVSPAPNKNDNFNNLYADVAKWTTEGWVDILIPQLYQEIGNSYNPFDGNLSIWTQYRGKAQLAIGHALYKFGDPQYSDKFQSTKELTDQFDLARANRHVIGSVMYNTSAIFNNKIGITTKLAELYSKPAIMPFVGRQVAAEPPVPSGLKLMNDELSWIASGNKIRFAVYYFSDLTAEGELIEITSASKLSVSKSGHYCVTALNVDNLESLPSEPIQKN